MSIKHSGVSESDKNWKQKMIKQRDDFIKSNRETNRDTIDSLVRKTIHDWKDLEDLFDWSGRYQIGTDYFLEKGIDKKIVDYFTERILGFEDTRFMGYDDETKTQRFLSDVEYIDGITFWDFYREIVRSLGLKTKKRFHRSEISNEHRDTIRKYLKLKKESNSSRRIRLRMEKNRIESKVRTKKESELNLNEK